MGLFRRRPKLPAGRRPALEPDERILAWAPTDGGAVVVTNRGLFLPDTAGRLDWHRIHKATWSGERLAVVPAEVVQERAGYAVVADQSPVSYPLAEPGDVPHQIRARVTRSVGFSVHHRLPGGGVRIAARRVSGVDGLTWTVRFDPGVDVSDPQIGEATDALVAAARAGT